MNTEVFGHAKINLFLNITGLLPDGYHALDTAMCALHLSDSISICSRTDNAVTVKGIDVPLKDNSAYLAASAYVKASRSKGLDITVDKRIPIGAGFGGSSADAAGVLRGIGQLFNDTELSASLAAAIGSDTAFQYHLCPARCRGRGELIEPIYGIPALYAVLAFADGGVSTKEAYGLWDKGVRSEPAEGGALLDALKKGECAQKYHGNALTAAAVYLNSAVGRLLSVMPPSLLTGMSGSGSGAFALFAEEKDAIRAFNTLDWDNKLLDRLMI